jgi:hypothetical protein
MRKERRGEEATAGSDYIILGKAEQSIGWTPMEDASLGTLCLVLEL